MWVFVVFFVILAYGIIASFCDLVRWLLLCPAETKDETDSAEEEEEETFEEKVRRSVNWAMEDIEDPMDGDYPPTLGEMKSYDDSKAYWTDYYTSYYNRNKEELN